MHSRTNGTFLAVLATFGLVACNAPVATSAPPTDQLAKQIGDLNTKLAELTKVVEMNESNRKWENEIAGFDRIAYLTPGADGYSIVRADLGNLVVSLDDIKPYANGSKVQLKFGNVFVATINGLKLKIEWGKMNPDGSPDNTNEKSRDVTFTQPLLPGAWTKVEIVLDGIPPADLGFVRVRDIAHTGIALRR